MLPFGGHLDKENRWVRLRKLIDSDAVDKGYSKYFENKWRSAMIEELFSIIPKTIGFVNDNKEWLFSGIGLSVLLLRMMQLI